MYDVIIIGAGPAGLTAAIYTSRRTLKTLVLSKNLGGQVIITPHVENYPGFKKIAGWELMKKMEEQVKDFGVEIIYQEVEQIKKKGKIFVVKTASRTYEAKALILAFGKTQRSLNVSGEKKFEGKGVSYCATCDALLASGKNVAVVGGGNSALDAALLLSGIAKKVYLIHRRDEFRGFESLVDKVKKKKNIECVLDSVITEFKGDKFLRSIIVQNTKTQKTREIAVNMAFIEVGLETKVDIVRDLVKLDENNQIIVNEKCETSCPGIFAAGDVTIVPFKQIVISAGEGAKAGLQAYNYIHGIKTIFTADWGSKK